MKKKGGFTLAELVVALALLGIVAAAAMRLLQLIGVQSVSAGDRAFAARKAEQMMEELRDVARDRGAAALDAYDDQDGFKYALSTRPEVNGAPGGPAPDAGDRPEDPLSGNSRLDAAWKYRRAVRVMPVPNEDSSRRVYVRVYRASDGELLAEASEALRK